MKLVGHRRVFSVEEVTGRLAEMFEGLRQFWVEAEIEDVRGRRRARCTSPCAAST